MRGSLKIQAKQVLGLQLILARLPTGMRNRLSSFSSGKRYVSNHCTCDTQFLP